MTSIPLPPNAVALNRGSGSGPSRIPMQGRAAVLFGSLFALPGVGIALLALGVIGDVDRGRNAPRWAVLVCGVIFFTAGAMIIAAGLETLKIRRRAADQQRHFPRDPWRWDHSWSETGATDGSGGRIARALGFALFLELFLTPFHWVGWFSPERPLPFRIIPLVFDLVVVGLLWHAGVLVARRRRFGSPVLRFARFPFLAGGSVEVTLPRFGQLGFVSRLTATLRCIQERYETRDSGDDRSREVVYYALWSETLQVEPSRRGDFEMRFELPADAPSSELSTRPARFWELELASGDIPGADYSATFLIPVYARGQA
ncbi:MAG TPA: hypothetical protein VHM67_15120 [Gemmatimonadaceae bacterium]|nr:hypothetical protein [Gemmatimonadaceae bacterium]